MIGLVLGPVVSVFITWVVARFYYKKSLTHIPDWAKPLVEKLPQSKPSEAELLKLFQEALNTGEIVPDPIFGHVACPECKNPASDFQEKILGDEYHTIIVKSCAHCGWNDHAEL